MYSLEWAIQRGFARKGYLFYACSVLKGGEIDCFEPGSSESRFSVLMGGQAIHLIN